ncbi:MAG: hypothetical protein ACYS8L_08480 [Planctomycetota bacterium]|jgi:hypothetical protein
MSSEPMSDVPLVQHAQIRGVAAYAIRDGDSVYLQRAGLASGSDSPLSAVEHILITLCERILAQERLVTKRLTPGTRAYYTHYLRVIRCCLDNLDCDCDACDEAPEGETPHPAEHKQYCSQQEDQADD